jgi:hypothetical protein
MTNPSAPIEAVSSQRGEEIEPKAGIAIANTKGQLAPNYSIRNFILYRFCIQYSPIKNVLFSYYIGITQRDFGSILNVVGKY